VTDELDAKTRRGWVKLARRFSRNAKSRWIVDFEPRKRLGPPGFRVALVA
jgi:hypothetical protein